MFCRVAFPVQTCSHFPGGQVKRQKLSVGTNHWLFYGGLVSTTGKDYKMGIETILCSDNSQLQWYRGSVVWGIWQPAI